MFVVLLTYTAPLERVNAAAAAHRDWLRRGYDDGVLLASGPQEPRRGGAILAHGLSRPELEARLAEDPFARQGLAAYAITQVMVRAADPRLAFLVE